MSKVIVTCCLSLAIASPIAAGTFDSTCYQKYNDKLIVSYYVSARNYNIELSQQYDKAPFLNTNLNYQADANSVTGIEIVYDKIGISFGIKATPPDDIARKGKTSYSNLNFSFGGNRWVLETSLRNYKGFYENNTIYYTPNFLTNHVFYQQPNFLNQSARAKFIYFFNHKKFAYKSSYTSCYRQFKTAFSWIMVSNLYYNKMATDTSFIPDPLRFYYNRQGGLSKINTTALSLGGGFSCNVIILKRLFANLTLALNPELQFSNYVYYPSSSENIVRANFAGDVRFATGYNGKNFFFTFTSINDICKFNYSKVGIKSTFVSGGVAIGYRFGVKTPGFYKRLQQTKIYGWL